jgi:hypothetical protein
MIYGWKVELLKRPWVHRWWRRWYARRGARIGSIHDLAGHVRAHAPGRRFVDVGCMWGVHGEYAFIAEEAGATVVKGVDIFGPTPEFEARKASRHSSVEFVLGDCTDPGVIARVGVMDVVLCAGVLYHHPSPFAILAALRQMCGEVLILRTSTIPEVRGLPQAAVYYPGLPPRARRVWHLNRLGVGHQTGITDAYDAAAGYGNWFWGLTPSCVGAMLETAGFQVRERAIEPFATTFICVATGAPFGRA